MAGCIAAQRRDGGALHLGASRQHGIERRRLLGLTPLQAPAHSLGDVAAELPRGKRPERAGVHADTAHLLAQAPPELRWHPVPARIRAAEQRHEAHVRAALQQLAPELERHRAARAEAGDDVRVARLERSDLVREVGGEVLHARERLAPAIESGRLEPEERLVLAQVLRQGAVAEHVAVVPRHGEHGYACPALLERHDRALVLLQPIAQLGRQRAGRTAAAQAVAIGPDADLVLAQLGEQGRHHHSSISSRLAKPPAGVSRRAAHTSASTAWASAATVGRSNSTRSGRSTPDAARSCDMSRAAMSEWPPRSKKLSPTPKSARSRTWRNTPITNSSVGERGAAWSARGAPAPPRGFGSALRSSLPLGERGSASSRTNSDGTMYSGLVARMSARKSATRSAGARSAA